MGRNRRYRNLTAGETDILISNGCSCEKWGRIKVIEGFDPAHCRNVIFSGDICLGTYKSSFTDGSGVKTHSGIMNAWLHNCIVGSDVIIYNIGQYIANYIIEDEASIRNCDKIFTEGSSAFGNGTPVAVLNEAGGRLVRIHDGMSAHEAYIIALYRHRAKAIRSLEKMADDYTNSLKSKLGTIGHNSQLANCSTIRNVRLGPYSNIDGAERLNEGSVNSCREGPVYIGPGVIMEHFIVSSGSIVTESTLVDKCFIGQGCILAKHYSAENSLFFANCGGYHGEACSVFAGPYTVTHHKSTLLIAGIFSFMNAGSGSNQSNHMYKLGPIHQGIMERGSKTTSDSYLLWPARIGPFTLVMGRHYKNMDTASLPFSYLIESNDESILVPGINLRSVGTIRDAQKWPMRDRRKDPVKTDQINFNLLSPFTIRKMFDGRDLLKKIKSETSASGSYYSYDNMKIKDTALERGIYLYQAGIDKFLGNSIIKRLEKTMFSSNEELLQRLFPDNPVGRGEWVDLAGLIAPKEAVDVLLNNIESGKIDSLVSLEEAFMKMHGSYYDFEWAWACARIEEEEGIKIGSFTSKDVIRIVEKWEKSVVDLDKLLYEDARKEFTLSSMTGFGIDGGDDIKKLDFEQVRGEFTSNSVVAAIHDHIEQKTLLGDELISRMRLIKE
ncbi:MAG: DUF4954 family protein [Bacteroidales bacterium]|jgi:hypothetical protein